MAQDLNAQIDGLVGLKKDWDSYNADPPTPAVIAEVREAVTQLDFFPPNHICADAEGGVAFCWFGPDKKYADIEFFNNGDLLACTHSNGTEIKVWQVDGLVATGRKIQEFMRGTER